jgi:hypothetical protein
MPTIFRISDASERGYLSFDLRDLVALVEPEAAHLCWHAIPMGEQTWIMVDETASQTMLDLPARVDASPNGVELSWPEMQELAASTHQTIWGTFIGIQPKTPLPSIAEMFPDKWHYFNQAMSVFFDVVEIAIQAVDSSFWHLYARDDKVMERIRAAFADVGFIDVGG